MAVHRDETWAAFDAALRATPQPEPPSDLRERCLPGAARRRRILVVDDEPNIRRLIELHLSGAGYQVLTACDGEEALAAVEGRRPDLIVLDVMMPGPDGFQVLETLKGDPETADIPVLMLTAKDGDDQIRHGWRTGADMYLTKPFNPEELRRVIDRMAAVLDTPENPPPLRRWPK
jgi:two-component system alkaline phosphatase synthesis response regulator PhoP/two-component system response regulator VicR